MAKTTWSFLDNPFDNRTKGNFKRMYEMATDHFDKLKAAISSQAELQAIYDFGLPAFKKFIGLYEDNRYVKSDYRFQTVTLENLMAELSSKLARRWDVMIQVEYDLDTPEYQSLMAGKRAVFQRSSYDMRISEVRGLARRLEKYPNLATLQQEVSEFAKKLEETRSAQQGKEGSEQRINDDLEVSREELAQVMLGMCYQICALYYKQLYKVENFYELKYLRRTPTKGGGGSEIVREELKLTKGQSLRILDDGEVKAGDTVQVVNTGVTNVSVSLIGVDNPPTTVNIGNFVSLVVPEDAIVEVVELTNLSEEEDGEVTVKVL